MWRIAFALTVLRALSASAQSTAIPGRDLLAFPIGLTAEAPPLGRDVGTGLWNPATAWIPDAHRWRITAAAMSAPTDIAVSAQVGSVARVWRGTTWGLSVARAAVGEILRTDSDPQSIGDEIPYSTIVVSALAARRFSSHIVGGVALRSRNGRSDNVSRTGISLDAGVLVEHLSPLDLRIGASSFLLSPLAGGRERASWLVGADARLVGSDSARTARAGYALQHAAGLSTEHYVFASGRWGRWEARGGPVRTAIYGESNWRLRLGITVRHAGYLVGVAREESAGGLVSTYHFSLSALLK